MTSRVRVPGVLGVLGTGASLCELEAEVGHGGAVRVVAGLAVLPAEASVEGCGVDVRGDELELVDVPGDGFGDETFRQEPSEPLSATVDRDGDVEQENEP